MQVQNLNKHLIRANAVCKKKVCFWNDNGCGFACSTKYIKAHHSYNPISNKDWKPVDVDLKFTPTILHWVPNKHFDREHHDKLSYVPSKLDINSI